MQTKKLNELTIVEAREGLRKKEFSVTDLVSACLEKIKKDNPKINAFITVCEKEALGQAKEQDKVIGKLQITNCKLPPLFGIPMAVKDNFCTKGIRTTAGSKILDSFIPPYDATVVKRLKDAGAIIIGKTNLDAWAHGSSTETSDYGTTRNPHDLTRSPGGSSGGSAAAITANMTIASIGSETAGSIRQPAAWCGAVGLKPTYGRVSRYGLIAFASSTDSPGPITKSVEDAAVMLSVLAGRDDYDATSSDTPKVNYLEELKKESTNLTIGVPKEYFLPSMNAEVKEKVLEALRILRKLGFKMKEISLIDPKYSIAVYTILQRAEASSNLERYDGIRYGNPRSFFGKEAKRRIMLGTYVLSAGYYNQYYAKAQKVRTLLKKDFEKVFKKVDLIVAPVSPTPALKIGESEKSPMFGEMQDVLVEASSLTGLPGISINCGWSKKGLPIGMQIIGKHFDEAKILNVSYQFKKNFGEQILKMNPE